MFSSVFIFNFLDIFILKEMGMFWWQKLMFSVYIYLCKQNITDNFLLKCHCLCEFTVQNKTYFWRASIFVSCCVHHAYTLYTNINFIFKASLKMLSEANFIMINFILVEKTYPSLQGYSTFFPPATICFLDRDKIISWCW